MGASSASSGAGWQESRILFDLAGDTLVELYALHAGSYEALSPDERKVQGPKFNGLKDAVTEAIAVVVRSIGGIVAGAQIGVNRGPVLTAVCAQVDATAGHPGVEPGWIARIEHGIGDRRGRRRPDAAGQFAPFRATRLRSISTCRRWAGLGWRFSSNSSG